MRVIVIKRFKKINNTKRTSFSDERTTHVMPMHVCSEEATVCLRVMREK